MVAGKGMATVQGSRDGSFPTVGMGGSAGALSAFQELFRGLPAVSESALVAGSLPRPDSADSGKRRAGKAKS